MDKTRAMAPRFLLAFVIAAAAWPVAAKPVRIVSTNVCADQLALALADRAHVISVSSLATQPQISNFVEVAKGIPVNHARAEEIIQLKPDLVIGDVHTGAHANRMAAALGVPVHVFDAGISL